MSVVEDLNGCLDGSPYLLEADTAGTKRADFLNSECARIETRHEAVAQGFAEQSEDIRARLSAMLKTRQVYESNRLERAGLPLAQTEEAILSLGSASIDYTEYISRQAVHADKHLLEVLGLYQATRFAEQIANDFAASSIPIREVDIRSLHQSTVPTETHAGSYREVEVQIAGSGHEPPNLIEVPTQMSQLVSWINTTKAPAPLAAAVVHSWLTIIHPFEDGNGRVARLLANVVLLRSGWPPLIIQSKDRLQYLDALSASDEAGNLLPLFDLFIKSIKATLKDLERPDLARSLFEADLRRDPDLRYDLWNSHLDALLNAIRDEMRLLHIDFFRVGVPDASTYLRLERGDKSGNMWLAKLYDGAQISYLLWLGFMSSTSADLWSRQPAPSIFISRRDDDPGATHPYLNPFRHGSPVSVDELTVIPRPIEKPVLIRRHGMTLTEHSIEDAASILARSLLGDR